MRPRHLLGSLATAVAISLMAVAPAAVHAQAALSFTGHTGSFLDGNTRMIGWQFSVAAPTTVAALGWFDLGQDGLNRAHEVGIWDVPTQTLQVSAVVPSGSGGISIDQLRWVNLPAPVVLLPGVSYRIAGLDIGSGGDAHVWDASIGFGVSMTGFSVNPAVQLAGPGFALGGLASQFSFPTGVIGDARSVLIGPNFSLSPVPEPASWLLMAAGAALLLRRAPRR